MKILIVEDVRVIQKRLETCFRPYGESCSAESGEEAIKLFKKALEDEFPYNLITLDIGLPDIDGHETLKRIRDIEEQYGVERNSSAKVLMVTASDDINNLLQSFKETCDAYLVKPVTEENVKKSLVELGLVSLEAD